VRKGLVALAAALAGLLTWAAAGFGAASFSDPAGDQRADRGGGSEIARSGPDITLVDVSNDQDGLVSLRITIANYTELPANAFIAVFFDLDRNIDTGDLGDESQIGWSSARGATYERWDGTRMVTAPADAIRASFANGVLTVEIPRTELNGSTSFDFLVGALTQVDEFLATDFAPRLGSHWTYHLALGALTLRATSVTALPARPVAGKRFTVSTAVMRTDTRTVVEAGSVTCTATVAGKKVRVRGGFANGRARCVLTVPRNTAGKLLRGSLTVGVERVSVRKSYRFRVLGA
jgi:hypothetical protein